jgi:hypothetical protein
VTIPPGQRAAADQATAAATDEVNHYVEFYALARVMLSDTEALLKSVTHIVDHNQDQPVGTWATELAVAVHLLHTLQANVHALLAAQAEKTRAPARTRRAIWKRWSRRGTDPR